MPPFSKLADPNVERLISDALNRVSNTISASDAAASIRAVVLGGGYGRGEGGAAPNGLPYNDLDFFVILNGSPVPPDLRTLLDDLSASLQDMLSIDVDFCCVDSLSALFKNADTLMVQELLAGHKIVFGDQNIFDGAPRLPFSELPWTEAARLLLNRGAGILFARERRSDPAQAGFVRRNLHKAALGCGDAILIARHAYKQTGEERLAALQSVYEAAWLLPAYKAALDFKYAPGSVPDPKFSITLEAWLRTLPLVSTSITGRICPADSGIAAADLVHAAPRSLKFLLLSLRYAAIWPPLLHSPAVHPRVKLLRLLTGCLQNPSLDTSAFLSLWRRFN